MKYINRKEWVLTSVGGESITLSAAGLDEFIRIEGLTVGKANTIRTLDIGRTYRAEGGVPLWSIRATAPKGETFEAVAAHRRWKGATVRGLMATVDRELPFQRGSTVSVLIRGEYTSDGTWHPDHGGRAVASRQGGNRGKDGWFLY
jgi:hypothetical protein